jgi:TIR domain
MNVFLSYASEQRALAERVCRQLEAEGHQVFFDHDDLGGGDSFGQRIRDEIERSNVLVFLISSASIAPPRYALTELAIAAGLAPRKRPAILPVRTDATPIDAVPAVLRSYTILDPQGDSVAEIALAVDRLYRRARRRQLQVAAVAALVMAAAGVAYWKLFVPLATPLAVPAGDTAKGAPSGQRDAVDELQDAVLKRIPAENRVRLIGQPGNDGWTLTFVLTDPTVRDIQYRTAEDAPFKSTGSTDNISIMTGQPLPNTSIRLPGAFWLRRAVTVKYTDARGGQHGPFQMAFDPRAEYLRFTKQALNHVAWITFQDRSPGERLAYFTTLVSYKPALREIRYSLDSAALDRVFPLQGAGVESGIPGAITDEVTYLRVPPHTRFITVRIAYTDGTNSEPRRFDVTR